MGDLPTGTVTFLFTDVEGSTRLWEQSPNAARQALVRHDALIEGLAETHQGVTVRPRGEGDSRFVVFARATDAVAASAAIQRALVAEEWPTPTPIKVRAALHTGEADLRHGDYYGSAVNRCARLRAIAHGGQTLVSGVTAELVRDALPSTLALKDLGSHRLKDLTAPERVYQVVDPALPDDFPPLRSLDVIANNLPVQLTSFVGRQVEVAEVKRLLPATRLLTLIGSGGAGKTRLALQVCAELVEQFPDGVWFVELASVIDPALVPGAALGALGVREIAGQPPEATLLDHLRGRRALVVLDNCEHLIGACAHLAAQLIRGDTAGTVHVLATSRAVLNVPGETTWRVPSLTVPTPDRAVTAAALDQYEAIRLFVERALAAQPGFRLTDASAPAVANICYRLDGIPLALELAAARVRVLSVEQIAARLDDRFRLLTGGSRELLPRQQTLRALIDWSHDLLSEPERALLRRLSVFVGGWTLEAGEAVSGVGPDVLDLLASLVDKSLVFPEFGSSGDIPRYRLLETIRQYGLERLAAAEEETDVRRAHAAFFLRLAESAAPFIASGRREAGPWLDCLEADHANLRAALDFLVLERDVAAALRLGTALWRFWWVRGYLTEGRERMSSLLGLASDVPTRERVRALLGAGALAFYQGDYPIASEVLRHSLALGRDLEDREGVAWSLIYLSWLTGDWGDYDGARALAGEALAICEAIGERQGAARALGLIGLNHLFEGRIDEAEPFTERALAINQATGDRWGIAWALTHLGIFKLMRGDVAEASRLHHENLAIWRELGDKRNEGVTLWLLSYLAVRSGDRTLARERIPGAINLFLALRAPWLMARMLETCAALAASERDPVRALRLAGAAEALNSAIGARAPPLLRQWLDEGIAPAFVALDPQMAAREVAAGRALSADQAIELALAD